MPRVYFYAGPQDTRAMADFFVAKTMSLVSTRFDDARNVLDDDLAAQPGCHVSPVPLDQIARTDAQRDADDPLIRDIISPYRQPVLVWRRSAVDGPWLIAGDLEWVDWSTGSTVFPDAPHLRALNAHAGKVFRSARRWMAKHWVNDGGVWFGPEAVRLKDAGLQTTTFNPDRAGVTTVPVGGA